MDISWIRERQGIGLALSTFGIDGRGLVDLARLAEELGYSSIWVQETAATPEPFSLLGAVAMATSRVQVGTGVAGVYGRTAPLTGQAIATIDDLSGGRAFLALGRGELPAEWHMGETRQLALRLREYTEAVRALLRGDGEYEGKLIRGRDLRLRFQAPRSDIPIFLASISEQTVEVVREAGDGWLPIVVPLSYIREVRPRLGVEKPVALWTVACVSEDREAARRYARWGIGYFLSAMPALRRIYESFLAPGSVDLFFQRWQQGDLLEAAAAIPDDIVDLVAIAGTPAECRERLMAYQAEQVYPVVFVPTSSMIEETLRALAPPA